MGSIAEFPVIQKLLQGLVFVATVWLAYVAIEATRRAVDVRRRVRALNAPPSPDAGSSIGDPRQTAWWRLVGLVEQSGLSLADSRPDALRRKLVAAGFDSPEAPQLYTLLRLLLIFLLPGAGIAGLIVTGSQLTILNLYIVGSFLGILGLVMPAWILRILTDRRQEAIVNGFPNCLDLMLVCVEAGLGMEAAMDRIGRELAGAEPLVSSLMIRTTLHLRAGASREEALRRLSDASGVSEIRSFCTLLIQAEKLGTSISGSLRVFASEMREKRKMRAEEKAHRLPVLISIPLVACMLPTMVGVLMLPAAIRVVRQLLPALGG